MQATSFRGAWKEVKIMTLETILPNTRERWIGRFNADKTKLQARTALIAYDRFLRQEMKVKGYTSIEEYEQMLFKKLTESDEQERYLFLDEMVQFWKEERKSPATIGNYFTFIRSYMRHNRIKTSPEDIKEYVSFPRKLWEIRQPLTITQIKQLLEFCNPRMKALFLFLISSGMRIGETLKLKISDIDLTSTPKRITIPAEITKTMQGREAYISNEAWVAVQPFVRGRNTDERIFDIIQPNVQRYMQLLRKRAALTETYSNGKNHLVTIHAFRAFFHTKATLLHGVEYAHAVLGHGSYLQQYFRLTDEERVSRYNQLEPYITIYEDRKTRTENTMLKDRIAVVDSVRRQQEMLTAFFESHPQFAKQFAAFSKR